MKTFKEGDYVKTLARYGRGGLGLVAEVKGDRLMVQFGADGPFAEVPVKTVRWATEYEVRILKGQV